MTEPLYLYPNPTFIDGARFTCATCGNLSRASVEGIADARLDGIGGTDAEVAAQLDYCLSCLEGKNIAGEHVADDGAPRVDVAEMGWDDERGFFEVSTDRGVLLTDACPEADDRADVERQIAEFGKAQIGGGAAPLFILTPTAGGR